MELQNAILIMGPPGSGKGTQSRMLSKKLNYAYFSMGDSLREYAKMDTDFGRQIKSTIDKGFAVADEVTKRIFEESLDKLKHGNGVIVEGYPRSVQQVLDVHEGLDHLGIKNVKVILLDVDKEKLMNRLILRSKTEGRADDADIASIEKRFDEYRDKTSKAKEYYESKGELIVINGDQPIEAVHQDILAKL